MRGSDSSYDFARETSEYTMEECETLEGTGSGTCPVIGPITYVCDGKTYYACEISNSFCTPFIG